MIICRKNLYHNQELQKQAYNKGVKPKSYTSGNKVWLNTKYIKTKQNKNLEAKFFKPFQILHLVGKQTNKIKLTKKGKIHDVFHMSLLEQDITRKGRVDKNGTTKLTELDGDNNGEYEIETIYNNAVYVKESESDQLPGLYYLIS